MYVEIAIGYGKWILERKMTPLLIKNRCNNKLKIKFNICPYA